VLCINWCLSYDYGLLLLNWILNGVNFAFYVLWLWNGDMFDYVCGIGCGMRVLDTFSLIFAIGGIVGWNGWFWMAFAIIIILVSIDWFVVQFWAWINIVLGKMRVWQWGNSASLAQASLSRLGESCRTSRLVWVALLAQATLVWCWAT